MSRLIDADALIDDCKKYLNKLNPSRDGKECTRMHWLIGILSNAPTIEERKWIPCSERLPVEGEVVLTQAKFKDDIKMAVSARVDFNYWTGWGTREINIVAWMPLPSVYCEVDV